MAWRSTSFALHEFNLRRSENGKSSAARSYPDAHADPYPDAHRAEGYGRAGLMMQHPEYFYWSALALFGVPAVVLSRAVVPVVAIAFSAADALLWAVSPSPQTEGWLLLTLYGTALAWVSFSPVRLGRCESFAAALWSPMAVVALFQALGADPRPTFWAIWVLAVIQAVSFALVGLWPVRLARGLIARIRHRNGGYLACPA